MPAQLLAARAAVRSTPSNTIDAGVGLDDAQDAAGRRALAAARLADEAQRLAAVDLERHVGHGLHRRRWSAGTADRACANVLTRCSTREQRSGHDRASAGSNRSAGSSGATWHAAAVDGNARNSGISVAAALDRRAGSGGGTRTRRAVGRATAARRRSASGRCAGRGAAGTPAGRGCTGGSGGGTRRRRRRARRSDRRTSRCTRSASPATTPRSWVTSTTARWRSRWTSASTSRIWAWIVTSRAVVGSSAISRSGSLASAIAIITRCRMPAGQLVRVRLAAAGRRRGSTPARAARRPASRPASRGPRVVGEHGLGELVADGVTGFSDVSGSWKIMPMRLPADRGAARRRARRAAPSPSKRTDPVAVALGAEQPEQRPAS